ncbi:Platelet-activating factor acetylhydrolase IB subunit gamma [Orchesella cincta]|uniref:Platelet-activating factor acetylhydrolase IB subunit gamma n=1 Tax=Orchesella cincta TaxID=48709 RepID=A0A1D2MIJ7_ORCCI|nr:Platelet-activating factor acetylhydrolase IB subunit gamma [Orchesella cincta]
MNSKPCTNPWTPAIRNEQWWLDRHQQILDSTANLGNQIKIVFIGSSLVEYWANEGRPVWEANYAPLGAINYGIGGDRTEHLLWRIANGELDGLTLKVVVLYIGSNNVPVNTVDDIVRGVNTVVDKIHEKLPNTNILLVGTFPRADQSDVSGTLRKIRDIDQKLEALVGGDTQRKGHFFDLFWFLAPSSLDRIYEHLYVGDKLHLNTEGYQVWQREMNSIFNSLNQ